MFHVKNHKQHNIFDLWEHLGPKRRKLLDGLMGGALSAENPARASRGRSAQTL